MEVATTPTPSHDAGDGRVRSLLNAVGQSAAWQRTVAALDSAQQQLPEGAQARIATVVSDYSPAASALVDRVDGVVAKAEEVPAALVAKAQHVPAAVADYAPATTALVGGVVSTAQEAYADPAAFKGKLVSSLNSAVDTYLPPAGSVGRSEKEKKEEGESEPEAESDLEDDAAPPATTAAVRRISSKVSRRLQRRALKGLTQLALRTEAVTHVNLIDYAQTLDTSSVGSLASQVTADVVSVAASTATQARGKAAAVVSVAASTATQARGKAAAVGGQATASATTFFSAATVEFVSMSDKANSTAAAFTGRLKAALGAGWSEKLAAPAERFHQFAAEKWAQAGAKTPKMAERVAFFVRDVARYATEHSPEQVEPYVDAVAAAAEEALASPSPLVSSEAEVVEEVSEEEVEVVEVVEVVAEVSEEEVEVVEVVAEDSEEEVEVVEQEEEVEDVEQEEEEEDEDEDVEFQS